MQHRQSAGAFYVADVGQNRWEEVDVAAAGAGGPSYGWNRMEGLRCYGSGPCSQDGLKLPALQYGHGDGYAIIGGFVYRGRAIPSAVGHYI